MSATKRFFFPEDYELLDNLMEQLIYEDNGVEV